jgi:3-oxoacyl-[acyl-carrier-protein] synthase-3
MLFGDAASAILVSKNSNADKSYFNFFSDGANHEAIIIPEGGYRKNITKNSLILKMNQNFILI